MDSRWGGISPSAVLFEIVESNVTVFADIDFRLRRQCEVWIVDTVNFGVSDFVFHDKFLHFVFEGTKTGGLSAEYVCYGLLFMYLIKSVMNTRTK